MRVAAIPGRYGGCWYYRCLLPGMYGGWDLPKGSNGNPDWKTAYQMAMNSDVVVFQRPHDTFRVEAIKLLKKKGKIIVFDNDDTYLPNKGVPMNRFTPKGQELAKSMNDNLYESIALSDLVITTTEYLADEYRELHDNVVVIPNQIDPLEEEEKIPNETGKKRIGFVGSVLSNDDCDHMREHVRRLAEDHQIVIFGIKNRIGDAVAAYDKDVQFWESINPEWFYYAPMGEYYHTLNKMKLDVMIIPRNDSYFNRCKSNLKFLESSLMRVPVVAQGFEDGMSPYQVNPKDSEHMRIVTDNDEWYDAIIETLDRQDMAEKAHDYVLENYDISNNYILWENEFQKLYAS